MAFSFLFSSLIAIYANKKRVVEAIELLSPRVSAVRCVAGVRRGEPRFAEPTWVAGVVRFGCLRIRILCFGRQHVVAFRSIHLFLQQA